MKYIIYGDSETDEDRRCVVVIDGRAYYQSTGANSNMKGVWLPFYGVFQRNNPICIRKALRNQKIRREFEICDMSGEHKHIGRFIKNNMDGITETDLGQWCYGSVAIRLNKKDIPADKLLFERLYLKIDLIHSVRLTDEKSFSQPVKKLMDDAHLSEDEIKLANNKIKLDDKPEFVTHNPQQVNEWLIAQGVPIHFYPSTYETLWKSITLFPQAEQMIACDYKAEQTHGKKLLMQRELAQARALLTDYTKNDSRVKRFFSGHWNRHHVKLVTTALQNKELNTVNKLVAFLRYTLGDKLDMNGSLARRLDFIETKTLNSHEKIEDACQLWWDHQQKSNSLKYHPDAKH